MITGKVAKIVSEDEVVINRGRSDGVEVGMVFAIKDDRLDDITDPDTGESLGSIDRPRMSIEIVRLGERAALGRRYDGSNLNLMLRTLAPRPRGILWTDATIDDVEVGDAAVWEGERVNRNFGR
jgi:hypothetical protein